MRSKLCPSARHALVPWSRALIAAMLLALGVPALAAASDADSALEGVLSLVWGDSHGHGETAYFQKVFLTDDSGVTTELDVSQELLLSGVMHWNGRRVKVTPRPGAGPRTAGEPLRVAAVTYIGGEHLGGVVTGSQPWISLLCKFADVSAEPEDLAFFQGMYANAPGGLDHYWREVSADKVNVVGSVAIDWIDLPGNHTSYVPTPGSGTGADLSSIFDDCTAAADPLVDFGNGGTPFAGINIMLNDRLDCCAWGGGRFATLDGISKSWRVTWDPPWAYRDEGVIAHEMGHGFGLPHANNWDADGNPYDSPWDVMSSATGFAVDHPEYGRLGKHINAYHKDRLGWFAPERRFVAPPNSSTSIELDHTAMANPSEFQMARIDINGSHWYTVEARVRSGSYEADLPGDAVIIHEVRTGRPEPSWAVDADEPPAGFGSNPGTQWTPGETFVDSVNQVWISVDYATATGFGITVSTGNFDGIFADGFEGGTLSEWSSSLP